MKFKFRKHKAKARIAVAAAAFAAGAVFDAELMIYGDIGENWWAPETSLSANNVVQQLRDVRQGDQLLVRMNSYGGSVTDGTAIYNALRACGATVTVRVEGIAASIASLISMAGDRVEMYANTLLMIHAPWSCVAGNATELRETADVLDTYAAAMATSYARKTGRSAADELALLADGEDHWFTAAEAKAAGYCDAISEDPEETAEPGLDPELQPEMRAAAIVAAMSRYRTAPAPIAASMRPLMLAALKPPKAVTNPTAPKGAATPRSLKMNFRALALALGISIAANDDDAAVKAKVLAHLALAADADDAAIEAALAKRNPAAPPAAAAVPPTAAAQRQTDIEAMFAVAMRSRPNDVALASLRDRLVIDASITVDAARTQLLAQLGNDAKSIAGSSAVSGGEDEADKRRDAIAAAILARVNRADERQRAALGQNPFRNARLIDMASDTLAAAGINVRALNRQDIAEYALGRRDHRVNAAQTTGDFSIALENTLHKILLAGFSAAKPTWSTFTKVIDVSDFRTWNLLIPGALGNLEDVLESGEYKNKVMPDATKNTVQAKRRGNIIEITPEVLVNDDIGYILQLAESIGQAGARTIEAKVYAALNSNPTLQDGFALFSSQHGNYVASGSGAAPTMTNVNAGKIAMASQKLPGDTDDYMDLSPSIAVTSLTTEGPFRQIVGSPYDPDAANKLQRPNIVYNLIPTIVSSARVSNSTAWYLFADPNIAPVIVVAFLDGQRNPVLKQDESFRTGGLRWRAELPFGVGVADYRGAYMNYGA